MPKKSDPHLTFRLSLDAPDMERAAMIARHLNDLQLGVASVTARGMLVSGPKSVIEQKLQARIDLGGKTAQFIEPPHLDEADGGASYRAYFPTDPSYFGDH